MRTLIFFVLMLVPSAWPASPAIDRLAEVSSLIARRQLESAEKIIASELTVTPKNAEWITLLAEVRIKQGREREAVILINEANALEGQTAFRDILTAQAESVWNRFDLAEPEFRAAIRLDPNSAAAHYYLARLLYTQGRFDEAIQESNNTIEISPGYVRAYENEGLCYEGKREFEEAQRWFMEAIRRDSTSIRRTEWPALDLATMLIDQHRFAEAKPYLTQALAINPLNAESEFESGLLLERTGDFRGALKEFRLAIQFDPHLARAYYQAGRICQKLGNLDEAEQDFEKVRVILSQEDSNGANR